MSKPGPTIERLKERAWQDVTAIVPGLMFMGLAVCAKFKP